MKKPFGALFLGLLAAALPSAAQAQAMDRYESREFNIGFDVPAGWHTEVSADSEVPSLISMSPDESVVLVVLSYEDAEIGTEELLDEAVDFLEVELEGEAREEEINGLHAWVAAAGGNMEGVDVGMFIMAATHGENNYVAYIFTDVESIEQNADVMNAILDSFAPLRG